MTTEWMEAARTYNRMSNEEQAAYWHRLGPAERKALEQALGDLHSPEATVPPRPRGCGRGCLTFLRKGCLTILAITAVLTLWSLFPSFKQPSSSRFTLWPDSTKTAESVLAPVERYLDSSEKQARGPRYFPANQIRYWLAAMKLEASDIAVLSFITPVADGGGWTYKSGEIDYREVASPVAILEMNKSIRAPLATLRGSGPTSETIQGIEALGFRNPWSESGEKWCLVALTDKTLLIGGQTGIEQILSVAAGKRNNMQSRRVLRPMLKDIEHATILNIDIITPTQEKSMPALETIATILQSIPGPSLLFSVRAKGTAFQKLPDGRCTLKSIYQFRGRAAGRLFAGVFWLQKSQMLENQGAVADISHEAGYAKLEVTFEPKMCTDDAIKTKP